MLYMYRNNGRCKTVLYELNTWTCTCSLCSFAVSNQTQDDNCDRTLFATANSWITSHNFPFQYKPGLDCQLNILQTTSLPRIICFTFYSFQMSNDDDTVEFWQQGDAIYKYSGNGVLKERIESDVEISGEKQFLVQWDWSTDGHGDAFTRDNVWSENFCCESLFKSRSVVYSPRLVFDVKLTGCDCIPIDKSNIRIIIIML